MMLDMDKLYTDLRKAGFPQQDTWLRNASTILSIVRRRFEEDLPKCEREIATLREAEEELFRLTDVDD